MLADVPVDLFMVDYRGYGRSGGGPMVDQLATDGSRAYWDAWLPPRIESALRELHSPCHPTSRAAGATQPRLF